MCAQLTAHTLLSREVLRTCSYKTCDPVPGNPGHGGQHNSGGRGQRSWSVVIRKFRGNLQSAEAKEGEKADTLYIVVFIFLLSPSNFFTFLL